MYYYQHPMHNLHNAPPRLSPPPSPLCCRLKRSSMGTRTDSYVHICMYVCALLLHLCMVSMLHNLMWFCLVFFFWCWLGVRMRLDSGHQSKVTSRCVILSVCRFYGDRCLFFFFDCHYSIRRFSIGRVVLCLMWFA